MKKFPPVVLASLILLANIVNPAQAQERVLTIHDVSPELGSLIAGTPLDFVAKEDIRYGSSGVSEYDDFYKNSAVAYGGMVVGQGLADDATMTLKGYARSKVAVAELEDEIAEITEGADPDDWTTEQSLAVLQAAEAKDQISAEERSYMVQTLAYVAATIPVVEAAVSSSVELTQQAPGLVGNARAAFGLRRAAGAARNVNRSAGQIESIPTEGPALVESLVVLSRGLAFVAGGQ
ncbi:MAG: hypothetical protein OEY63_05510 [Gemmatimonadota bacterium]|nr:hypothetical protein [Gemmatimonadota bacterium]